jgi:RNA polymerase sigma factor (TIGR02999 family)
VSAAISGLIQTADTGNGAAAKELFAALYHELHGLAERQLRRGGAGLTLGTTTLLHEAYLNLVNSSPASFPDRARFLAYASRVMRSLVINYLRHRRAKKRGGEFHITRSGGEDVPDRLPDSARLDQLSEALDTLGDVDRALAELVDLHFFCGFSLVEIAALRGVSDRTVQRDWRKARIVLHELLEEP